MIQTYRKACNSRLASDWDSVKDLEKKKNVRKLIIRKKRMYVIKKTGIKQDGAS